MSGVTCRQCGAEIADKAIVCYKCGTATTEAVFKAPAARRSMPRANWIVIVAVLLLFAAFVAYTDLSVPSQSPRAFSQIIIGFAVTLVVLRAIIRRRR